MDSTKIFEKEKKLIFLWMLQWKLRDYLKFHEIK